MKVVMAVTNDLLTDRRVMRHAETLREAGCEVECIGKRELGVKARRGWRFYAEYNVRLMLRLLRTKADIVWANDTDTLAACTLAAKLKGKKLVMDAHELFPEVPELIGRERVKRVWEWIERMMMPRCDALLTVCQSIADYYKERYGVEMVVVRNVRRVESGEWRAESGEWRAGSGKPKMLLYQGAVNKGRGVDWAIDALEWLEDCRLVVAGGGDLLEEMKAYAAKKPWAERIAFMGRLMPEELEGLTRKADVGLVMLEDMGLSYHFALPNRIGDFVAAGVPIVVSDLPEMSRVVREYGVGEVIESGERR
ncbi:MAG: glycosyltransferase, partial [Bacteroidales bacterium]|nr:glycosyltransferase [Bacteroidales bacterium]